MGNCSVGAGFSREGGMGLNLFDSKHCSGVNAPPTGYKTKHWHKRCSGLKAPPTKIKTFFGAEASSYKHYIFLSRGKLALINTKHKMTINVKLFAPACNE